MCFQVNAKGCVIYCKNQCAYYTKKSALSSFIYLTSNVCWTAGVIFVFIEVVQKKIETAFFSVVSYISLGLLGIFFIMSLFSVQYFLKHSLFELVFVGIYIFDLLRKGKLLIS